jgi:uncharacterized membrane protein
MRLIIDNPRASLLTGMMLAGLVLVVALIAGETDRLSLLAFLLRLTHVLAAMVWVGLVFFVNFVQLVALKGADDGVRGVIHTAIVPHVAWWFRHASTLTVLSGAVLLVLAGYLVPALVYGTSVYVPAAKAIFLWTAVLGALAMWMFVHMYIWPNMQVVLGLRPGGAEAKNEARRRVILFARLNLIIVVPVVMGMIAAAHLY